MQQEPRQEQQGEQKEDLFDNLTREEKDVLLQCKSDAFRRALPIALATGFITNRLIAWRGNAFFKRGSFWWTIGAAVSGHLYVIQRYRDVCLDKVMQLQNSRIGDRIRKNIAEKRQKNLPLTPWERKWMSQEVHTTDDSPQYTVDSSDSVKRQEPPQPEVSMFSGGGVAEVKENKPKRRTFEEIREENRRRQQQQPVEQQPHSVRESQSGEETSHRRPARINKYGDTVYDDE